MDIITDYLDEEKFLPIKYTMLDANFPWYYHSSVAYDRENFNSLDDPYNFQFVHSFYNGFRPNSNFIDLLAPFLDKMKINSLIKIKANLITRTDKIVEYPMHVDVDAPGSKTSIFYINSNDGYTKFEDGTIINSEENKFVTFDSSLKHTGTSCTNEKCRIVLNFNYY